MEIGFGLLLLAIGLAVCALVLVAFGSLADKLILIKHHLRPSDEDDSEQEDQAVGDPSNPEEHLKTVAESEKT